MPKFGPGFLRLASCSGLLLLAIVPLAAHAQAEADAPAPAPPPGADLPKVEPVITDEEFKKAVPPLTAPADSELDRPLESIQEFERRISAEQGKQQQGNAPATTLSATPAAGATPAPGATPATATAATSPSATAPVGEEPILDPELNKPLPPLDQFQPEPVQIANGGKAPEAPELRYEVELRGLDKADGESSIDMRGLFKGLSALRGGGGKAANRAMVRARLDEDQQLVEHILASEGWYSARVRTRLEAAQGDRPLTAVIDVVPGKRYSFGDIVIDAKPTIPPDLIRSNLALKVGQPIIADRVQGAEAQIAVALPQQGYPFAKVGDRDILLDRDTGTGVYTLPVDIGPRSRFDGITTDGDLAFSAKHVRVLTRYKHGDLYDSRKVDDLRKALVATGLFNTVSVEPQKTGESAADGTEYVNLHVHQEAGPPRTIAGTAGYETGQGFSIEGSWTHRNMFPPEGALIVHAIAGTAQQGGGVTFRRSNAGKRDRSFEVAADVLHSDIDAYNAYTGRLSTRMSYDSTPIWQKRLTWALGAQLLATAEKDYDFAAGERKRHTYYVAGLTGQLGFDTSDDLLNPTKGFRLTGLVQPEAAIRGGFNPYVRAQLDASGYFPATDSLVLAGRVRVATIQGASRAEIPPSLRLYAGGGGSVRGFGYRKLGPLDPNGDPIGGRSLNEASAEVRYRFGNYGIVAFVDTGQSYAAAIPRFNDLRFGAGIGGRFYTNFGPVRLDIATPIDHRPGESRINIYVSIGQAF